MGPYSRLTLQGVVVTYKLSYNDFVYNDFICAMAYTLEPSSSHGSLCSKTSQLNNDNLDEIIFFFFLDSCKKEISKGLLKLYVCPTSYQSGLNSDHVF